MHDTSELERKTFANPGDTIRVLAIDDDLSARKLLSVIFAPPLFHCEVAGSGDEGLRALQRERFDVVISDLCMPGIDGMQVLVEVRKRHPHVAFLVTTGLDDLEMGVKAMHLGADDYLVKPVTANAVIACLERALQKRRVEQQLEDYRRHLEEMVAERTKQLQAAVLQIECSYEETLKALGAAIDLRDGETEGHSQRVCSYSLELARALHFSDQELRNLSRGAYLHDIGKLGIPDSILLKPGDLTPDEWIIMKQHAQIGFDLLKEIPFLKEAAEVVLSHHERYDGSGYPRGLRSKEILVSARVFAVADALDAITSNRPYHCGTSFESARETIRELSGSRFDPEVVEVFLAITNKRWLAIAGAHRRNHDGQSRFLKQTQN